MDLSSAQPTVVTPGQVASSRLSAWAILPAMAALASLALSLAPATLWPTLLGPWQPTAGGDFTRALYAQLGTRLRLVGLVFAILAASAIVLRPRFGSPAAPFASDLRALLADTVAPLQKALRPEHRLKLSCALWLGLAAAAARLAYLGQPIRYDEAITYDEFASHPLWYALSYYPEPNNHVLHTLLVQASTALFGSGEWALRLPALAAGLLLVPATYACGRLLYGTRVGWLAAGCVAGSSYLVEFSTLARGYTLQALCFLLAFALVVYTARQGNLAALALAAACVALGFWVVPTMLYGAVVIAAWLLAAWVGERAVRQRLSLHALASAALFVALLAFAFYVPVLVVSGPESLASNRFVAPLSLDGLLADLPRSLRATWALWTRDVPLPLVAVLVLGVVLSVVWGRGRGGSHLPLAVLAPVVCLVLLFAQRVVPFERVWLFLLPLVFLVSMAGLVALVDRLAASAWPSLPAPLPSNVPTVRPRGSPARGSTSSPRTGGDATRTGLGGAARTGANMGSPRTGANMGSPRTGPSMGAQRMGLGGSPGTGAGVRSLAVPVLAPLVASLLAGLTIASGAVARSMEVGAFPAAESVTLALRGTLRPTDAVRTAVPASLPELQYYFKQHGLDSDALVRDPADASRTYLVSPAADPGALARDERTLGIDPAAWLTSEPRPIGNVWLYRLDRGDANVQPPSPGR